MKNVRTHRQIQIDAIEQYIENGSTFMLENYPMSEARRKAMCSHYKKTFDKRTDLRYLWKEVRYDWSWP